MRRFRDRDKGGFTLDRYRQRFDSETDRAGRAAADDESVYRERARDFDPYEAVRTSANAAYEEFRPQLNEDVQALRGQQVGMGRLDTGFATEDEDRLVRDSARRLENTVAQQSLQAAGLDLSNINALGAFSAQGRQQYLDLVAGGYDRLTAEENAKKERRGGLFGALGSVVGGVGGLILSGGNPMGAAAGARIGGAAGRGIGG